MNAVRRMKSWIPFLAVAVLGLGALALPGGVTSAQDPPPPGKYYHDRVSKCKDRCRLGFEEPTCRCYVMEPIVVRPK